MASYQVKEYTVHPNSATNKLKSKLLLTEITRFKKLKPKPEIAFLLPATCAPLLFFDLSSTSADAAALRASKFDLNDIFMQRKETCLCPRNLRI
jgi:hypothetical protein